MLYLLALLAVAKAAKPYTDCNSLSYVDSWDTVQITPVGYCEYSSLFSATTGEGTMYVCSDDGSTIMRKTYSDSDCSTGEEIEVADMCDYYSFSYGNCTETCDKSSCDVIRVSLYESDSCSGDPWSSSIYIAGVCDGAGSIYECDGSDAKETTYTNSDCTGTSTVTKYDDCYYALFGYLEIKCAAPSISLLFAAITVFIASLF